MGHIPSRGEPGNVSGQRDLFCAAHGAPALGAASIPTGSDGEGQARGQARDARGKLIARLTVRGVVQLVPGESGCPACAGCPCTAEWTSRRLGLPRCSLWRRSDWADVDTAGATSEPVGAKTPTVTMPGAAEYATRLPET
jgi:hypothetical protein